MRSTQPPRGSSVSETARRLAVLFRRPRHVAFARQRRGRCRRAERRGAAAAAVDTRQRALLILFCVEVGADLVEHRVDLLLRLAAALVAGRLGVDQLGRCALEADLKVARLARVAEGRHLDLLAKLVGNLLLERNVVAVVPSSTAVLHLHEGLDRGRSAGTAARRRRGCRCGLGWCLVGSLALAQDVLNRKRDEDAAADQGDLLD
uniref:Uncharacterized protein n=1 Tax=Diacronema lutheri TaxID=2081491 RepID=A0A7R9UV99_DIALT|mmetsp:Transcript_3593/g.11221  ORF Transcript_3593/g.11221 Transcript_3593/m.11221 type:complete len:205 (+) Transcript_3593:284-898(+)